MLTYQDLLAVGDGDKARADFVRRVIGEHKSSELYQTAKTADTYYRCRNQTTMEYQKTVTDLLGKQYVDPVATVHRSTSNFYYIFVTQMTQYLLGNGVTWEGGAGDRLGEDFDSRLQEMVRSAQNGGVAFGFWNLDHLEVFPVYNGDNQSVFAPLYDEETGGLTAGVRSWQLEETKPLRATLYEPDGYTDFMWRTKDEGEPEGWVRIDGKLFRRAKRPYKLRVVSSESDGETVLDGENYPYFPIVPLFNPLRQSSLVGMREKIDAYDFILNGWEDDLDSAQLYWVIQGAGGMDDPDLLRFLDRLRTVKAAAPADGQTVEPVTVDIPVQAREELLLRLEKQLYRDAMIMNPEDIANGAATATQIRAAYERQNVKADQLEYAVIDFIQGVLAVAGIEDTPTFTRSVVVNISEELTNLIQAASYLGREYVTRRVLTLLGDGDRAEEVLRQIDGENMDRLGNAGGRDRE